MVQEKFFQKVPVGETASWGTGASWGTRIGRTIFFSYFVGGKSLTPYSALNDLK